uniref:Uncharacterized protein n=1 Tax=Anguilla anguilla TaxID=7936 RepID=A0A0E9Q620_ANGAN
MWTLEGRGNRIFCSPPIPV